MEPTLSQDPFSCFEDDSDCENDETRDPSCGVLSFHKGTEQAMLVFVQQHAIKKTPAQVRAAVDTFCQKRHWMMHVGPQKSQQLTSFLRERVTNREFSTTKRPFILLELGTYCGYSSILWAECLQSIGIDFHVYSLEADPTLVSIAKNIIDVAGLTDFITILYHDINDVRNTLFSVLSSNSISYVDFVFLDHDKDAYLDDLQSLEAMKLIRAGVAVVADNVLFAQIKNYRRYLQIHAINKIVTTQLESSFVEYSDQERLTATNPKVFDDGMGKQICI
jgi:catechol O-methyltransferase